MPLRPHPGPRREVHPSRGTSHWEHMLLSASAHRPLQRCTRQHEQQGDLHTSNTFCAITAVLLIRSTLMCQSWMGAGHCTLLPFILVNDIRHTQNRCIYSLIPRPIPSLSMLHTKGLVREITCMTPYVTPRGPRPKVAL